MWWRRRFVPATLRGRITLAYALGVAVTVTVGLAVAYAVLTAQLRSAATEELHTRLAVLAAAVGAGDEDALLRDPYAQLLGADGVAAHSPAAPGTPVLTAEEQASAARGRVTLRRPAPGLGRDAVLAAQRTGHQTVVVGASLTAVNRAADRILLEFAVFGALLMLLLSLGVRRLVNRALAPVAAITAEASAVSVPDVPRRLPVPPGDDEIAELARTLNGMLARLAAAQERERAFVDDAAHELRTPIAVLRAELELGLGSDDPAIARDSLRRALAEVERLGRLSSALLVLARARSGELPLARHPTDVTSVVRARGAQLGQMTGLRVSVVGPELVADLDVARLEEVVANLVDNAAAAGATQVELRLSAREGGGVDLAAHDDGSGFPEDVLPLAFARFSGSGRMKIQASTDARAKTAVKANAHLPARGAVQTNTYADGQGAGLGLAIVEAIARAHGGAAKAGNGSPLGGAWVRVALPDATPGQSSHDSRTRGSSTA